MFLFLSLSLSLSPPLTLSLKSINISSDEDFSKSNIMTNIKSGSVVTSRQVGDGMGRNS